MKTKMQPTPLEPGVKRWWKAMKNSNKARLWFLRCCTYRLPGESEADLHLIREAVNEDMKVLFREKQLVGTDLA